MMTHSTENAQRRLLEAFSRLQARPSGIEGLLLGLPIAVQLAEDCDLPELAAVYVALGDLAGAVQADHGGVPA